MTTTLEMHKGFPYAFFLPLPIFASGLLIFLAMNGSLVTFPPQGSTVLQSVKDLLTLRGKSSATNDLGTGDDIYSALSTCKIFLFFPFYFVCHLQMFTNLISQAGSMDAHGLPNDLLISINPLTVIIFAPTLDMALYPILQRYNIRPRPIARITFGFICMSAAMAYAACLQSSIYKSPPCYSYPRHEDCFAGNVPNQIHIAAQIPVYVLGGISEVFTLSTGMEWAAMRAPASMRSLVVAVFASTFAGGAGLAMVISPLAKDPLLVRMYAVLSGVVGAAGATFWVLFRNKEEIGGKLDI
jgi:POT family proton-dependent oligopeptide transporter